MIDISKQYSEAVKKAGFEIQSHTSRLRQCLLNTILDMKAVLSTDKRTWNLVFDTDLSKVVNEASNT